MIPSGGVCCRLALLLAAGVEICRLWASLGSDHGHQAGRGTVWTCHSGRCAPQACRLSSLSVPGPSRPTLALGSPPGDSKKTRTQQPRPCSCEPQDQLAPAHTASRQATEGALPSPPAPGCCAGTVGTSARQRGLTVHGAGAASRASVRAQHCGKASVGRAGRRSARRRGAWLARRSAKSWEAAGTSAAG